MNRKTGFRHKGEGRSKIITSGTITKANNRRNQSSIDSIGPRATDKTLTDPQAPQDNVLKSNQKLEKEQSFFTGKEDVIDNLIKNRQNFSLEGLGKKSTEVEIQLFTRQDQRSVPAFHRVHPWLLNLFPEVQPVEIVQRDYTIALRDGTVTYIWRIYNPQTVNKREEKYLKSGSAKDSIVLPSMGNNVPRMAISIEAPYPYDLSKAPNSERIRQRWQFPIDSNTVRDKQIAGSYFGVLTPSMPSVQTAEIARGTIDMTIDQSANGLEYSIEIELDPSTITHMKSRTIKPVIGQSIGMLVPGREESYLSLSEAQLQLLDTWIKILYTVIDRTGVFLTTADRAAIIKEFNGTLKFAMPSLSGQMVNRPKDLQIYDLAWLVPEQSETFMTMGNWDDTDDGNRRLLKEHRVFRPYFSIPGGFYVSLKADGTRYMLFIAETGIYLINPLSGLITQVTGNGTYRPHLRNITPGTIIDVEVIGDIRPEGTLDQYKMLAFDMLSNEGQDVRELSYTERLTTLQSWIDKIYSPNYTDNIIQANSQARPSEHAAVGFDQLFIIRAKPVYRLPNLDAISAIVNPDDRLLAARSLANEFFKILGSVAQESVYSNPDLEGSRPQRTGPIEWYSDGAIVTPADRPYIDATDVFNQSKDSNYSLVRKWKINMTIDFKVARGTYGELTIFTYHLRDPSHDRGGARFEEFDVSFAQLTSMGVGKIHTRAWNGNVVLTDDMEGKIIEFEWAYSEEFSDYAFVPYGDRSDRPKPNPAEIVADIWNLITDPITVDMLAGKTLTLMRRYHNRVKNIMLAELADRIDHGSILDIGSGQGGDANKWRSFSEVYAVEPNLADIREMLSRQDRQQKFEIAKDLSSKDKYYANRARLHARSRPSSKDSKIHPIHGLAQDLETLKLKVPSTGVKAITMFNVLTFFYESKNSIQQLISTLKQFIVDGGYFYTIAFDGEMLMNTMRADPTNQFNVDGTELATLDRIKTKNITIEKVEDASCRKIWIKIEGGIVRGQYEYLVNAREFVQLMADEGFRLIEERYLDEEMLLSDEEYWFSGCFKLLKFRGYSNSIKRDLGPFLNSKLKSMEAAKVIEPLQPHDAPQRITSTQLSRLGINGLLRYGNPQDGSCYVHACLRAFLIPYKKLLDDQKQSTVTKLRRELAEAYTLEYHRTFGNGFFETSGLPAHRFETIKANLADAGFWIPSYMMPYIGDRLKVNVYVLRGLGAEVYRFGESAAHIKPGRMNIVVYWINDSHFETVGLLIDNNQVQTVFGDDHPLIRAITSIN